MENEQLACRTNLKFSLSFLIKKNKSITTARKNNKISKFTKFSCKMLKGLENIALHHVGQLLVRHELTDIVLYIIILI